MSRLLLFACCALVIAQTRGLAMKDSEIPISAPRDSIMASPAEIAEMKVWASDAFAGGESAKARSDGGLLSLDSSPPFSFVYGGVPSSELLKSWTRSETTRELADRTEQSIQWSEPKTGLCVSAVVSTFKDYPAVDWILYFENQGSQDTPILEKIQALDASLRSSDPSRNLILHRLHGDACGENSFLPYDTPLEAGKSIHMAPSGGRPSNSSAFPFFNLEYQGRGLLTAIGWSGQWAATLDRSDKGPTRFQAGMEQTHFLLHPGEKIRTPRVLLMAWEGDRAAAHNRFRRLLMFHYVPKINSRPLRLPVTLQTFDAYIRRPGWATEAGQVEGIRTSHELGGDTYWFDAGWFVGDFPNGVGNFTVKPQFPHGLKPLGDAAHKLGLKYLQWFEPERVAPQTEIAREHPEWVFGLGEGSGLFNLGIPEARRWLTDKLSRCITDWGIDVYRNDFNIDPLGYWREGEASDRQGINEIRYVEGHYAMWDELLAKHPGMMIDNCASGGRRIDLETMMRSVPLWRSDTGCQPGHPEWNQLQSAALSLYIPLHTNAGWSPEPYDFRGTATAGAIFQFRYLEPGFDRELAKATIAEAKENQKYWYGDFYALTSATAALDQFMAYQFHRADLNEGILYAFRRQECNTLGLIVGVQAVNPNDRYAVEFIDDARNKTTRTMTGEEMQHSGIELRIKQKPGSLIVRYKKL